MELTHRFSRLFVKRVVPTAIPARMSGQPEGSVMTILFTLGELEYMALNGGPSIQCSPSISFFVNCDTKEELDQVLLPCLRAVWS
ncbi:MAG: VOC family protein [Cyanobacteriota/Melainabacteria group bacterium]